MSELLIERDDVTDSYLAKRQTGAVDALIERARARSPASGDATPGSPAAGEHGSAGKPTSAAPAGGEAGADADIARMAEVMGGGSIRSEMLQGTLRGAKEMPRQAIGGVSDALHETFSALDSLAWWLESKMPLGTFPGVNPLAELAGPADRVSEAETTAGAITRDVARFLTGFVPLLRGGRAVATAAGAPKAAAEIGAAAAAGGVTDFFTRSPTEAGLADLLNKHEALRNPVSDYLAAKPEDNEAELRLKRGLEGAGLGLAGDGMLAALRAMRSARGAGSSIDDAAQQLAAQAAEYGRIDPARDFIILGDPRQPAFKLARSAADPSAKLDAAGKAVETGVPEDVAARGLTKAGSVGGDDVYINFARMEAPDDIKKVLGQMADAFKGEVDEARRGVQSNAETARLAADLGMTVDDLLARRQGQAFNAEEGLAARKLWSASAAKLLEVAEKAAGPQASPVDQFNFRKMLATHYAVQAEVIAARTETARALQAWAIPAGSGVEQARAVQQLLDGMGGLDVSRAMAQRLAALKGQGVDAAAINAAARAGAWVRSMDAVKEIYINGLLSSPTTHIVNMTSNSMVALQQIFERGVAERIADVTGSGGVASGEAAAMTFGLLTGLKDAFRLAAKSFREDNVGAALGKIEIAREPAVSARAFNLDEAGTAGRVVDLLGTAARVPGRMLGAEDEFFKSIGYRMELFAQAWRQAGAEGLAGPAAGERVAAIIASPPEHIRLAAADAALYATFANKPGDFAQRLLALRNSNSAMTFVLPFVRTPANIMTYAFERSPLAPLTARFREDIAAGGARGELALARLSTGSAVMALAFEMAESGQLTGNGPDDPGEREALQRQGWQAYSLKVGDKYVSYQRLDPLGMTLGLAADMAELIRRREIEPDEVDEANEIIAASIAAVARTAISKSYLQGVSDLVEALAQPERQAVSYLEGLQGSFIPAAANTAARATDPGIKEVMGFYDAVAQRLPGLRAGILPARDLWGRERKPDEIYGRAAEVLSPVRITQAKDSPIDAEIQRLNLDLRRIGKKVNWDGVDVNFRDWPEVYDAYTRLAGNGLKHPAWGLGAKDFLDAVVSGKSEISEVYQTKTDGEDGGKAVFIKDQVTKYRALARREILADPAFAKFADFIAEGQAAARQKRSAIELSGEHGSRPAGASGAMPQVR